MLQWNAFCKVSNQFGLPFYTVSVQMTLAHSGDNNKLSLLNSQKQNLLRHRNNTKSVGKKSFYCQVEIVNSVKLQFRI